MCFPSEHHLRKLIYVLLHATKAWVQPRWFQWRSRKLMENRRELMKPSCFCTIALRAGIKRCQLHSRKTVQKNGNLLMGADVRLHRLPVLRKAKKPGGRPRVSKCWCWLDGSPNAFAPGVKAAGGMRTQPAPSPCCRLRLWLIILSCYKHSSNSC